MKTVVMLLFVFIIGGAARAADLSGTVSMVFACNDTLFFIQINDGSNQWYCVRESVVGPTNIDRMHSLFLDAMVSNRQIWIGTSDTPLLNLPGMPAGRTAYDILGTSSY
ncbi:MAG: hypothetical protein WBM07_13225 [Chitinivibrionales bacterium]